MKLHEALKKIVEKEDKTILMDKNIVNIISDYYPDVFKPISLKKICRYVFNENYVLYILSSNNEDITVDIPRFTDEIVKKEGFSEECTTYVLKSLAFAAGLDVNIQENHKNCNKEFVSKKDNSQDTPQLHSLLRTMVEKDGKEIFFSYDLIAFINDYFPYVFKPNQIKRIFNYLRNDCFLDYHTLVYDKNEKIVEDIRKIASKIIKKRGYSEEYTYYVLKSIAYAVGLNVELGENQNVNNGNSEKGVEWYGPTPQKNDKSHLYFKDVIIFGYAKSFVDQMLRKGYSIIKTESDENNYTLKGSYSGIPSKLMVQISPKTHRTSRVMVIFDDKIYKNWPALKGLYFNLKEKLTLKYGKPSSETEAFFPPYKDGCGKEIKLLDENLGAYQSKYDVDGGEITLTILSEARVIVAFLDTLGCIELNKEFELAAQDDM